MIFPQLPWLTIVAPLCLRLMVGAIYLTSGWRHMKDPAARCKDIGISKRFTLFLGAAELAGALGVIPGVLIQPAAAGLILLMAGAIEKKILVWQTGFLGKHGYKRLELRFHACSEEFRDCYDGRRFDWFAVPTAGVIPL